MIVYVVELLDGWNVDVPSRKYPRNLESPRVSSAGFGNDSKMMVITRYHQENTIERHRYSGAGWLVWGGIIIGSRTDLHVQCVTMTDHIYLDVILEQHLRLFRSAMGAEFFFIWMTTPVLTVQTLYMNAFNRRISPVWIGQHTHRT
ncbi:DDE_3 domain-containing protein [Trichonephila clavipes]|nr:DDE_3 domain-containing protein [Trichonephila clavipes]